MLRVKLWGSGLAGGFIFYFFLLQLVGKPKNWIKCGSHCSLLLTKHFGERRTGKVQAGVPLLPSPCCCWRSAASWLMIRGPETHTHTQRQAGTLEDQFITLYFAWPSLSCKAWRAAAYPRRKCTSATRSTLAHALTHTYTQKNTTNNFCLGCTCLFDRAETRPLSWVGLALIFNVRDGTRWSS